MPPPSRNWTICPCGRLWPLETKTAGGGGAALFCGVHAGRNRPMPGAAPGHQPPGSGGRWSCFGWNWTIQAERRAEGWSDTTGSRGIRAVDAAAGNAARRAGVYGAAGTAPGKGTAASACGPLAGRGDELLCRLCDSGECEYALCSRLRAAAFLKELAKAVCLSPSLAAAVENEYAAGGTERAGERPEPFGWST